MKFACTMATTFIVATMSFFLSGYTLAGYITGGSLIAAALSAGVLDLCIPSLIYNAFFNKENRRFYF
ncbi:MAG: DUF4395 family protein [Bacteroidia bacterium]